MAIKRPGNPRAGTAPARQPRRCSGVEDDSGPAKSPRSRPCGGPDRCTTRDHADRYRVPHRVQPARRRHRERRGQRGPRELDVQRRCATWCVPVLQRHLVLFDMRLRRGARTDRVHTRRQLLDRDLGARLLLRLRQRRLVELRRGDDRLALPASSSEGRRHRRAARRPARRPVIPLRENVRSARSGLRARSQALERTGNVWPAPKRSAENILLCLCGNPTP